MIAVQQDLRVILAANIVRRRKALGLTQSDFARRMDVSQPYVVKLEKGRVGVGLEQLSRIADILDTTADVLLKAPKVEKLSAAT